MEAMRTPFERKPIRLRDVHHAVIIMALFAADLGMRSKSAWGRKLGIHGEIVRRWFRGVQSPYGYQLWILAESINCDIVLVPRGPKPDD